MKMVPSLTLLSVIVLCNRLMLVKATHTQCTINYPKSIHDYAFSTTNLTFGVTEMFENAVKFYRPTFA